jgi:hypothetical protein
MVRRKTHNTHGVRKCEKRPLCSFHMNVTLPLHVDEYSDRVWHKRGGIMVLCLDFLGYSPQLFRPNWVFVCLTICVEAWCFSVLALQGI